MSLNLNGLAVGDVIGIRRTCKVTEVDKYGVHYVDVQNGSGYCILRNSDYGSLGIEMVKKAAKPKSKVGDVLSGAEIREHQWKRGTVLEGVEHIYVLKADGTWFSPGSWNADDLYWTEDITLGFEQFYGSAQYKVIYLP